MKRINVTIERIICAIMIISIGALASGCDSLRFAPSEHQKQNAYLHSRTIETICDKAEVEETSVALQQLAEQAYEQSESMLAYFGLPETLPNTENDDELLSSANVYLTKQARSEAIQRPDPWQVADSMFDIGLAIAGIAGGVFGTRAAGAIRQAKNHSKALKEIIQGNELFKQQKPELKEEFKTAHAIQSPETKHIVANLK